MVGFEDYVEASVFSLPGAAAGPCGQILDELAEAIFAKAS